MADRRTVSWLDAHIPHQVKRALVNIWRALFLLAGALAASEVTASHDRWWALAAFILFAIYATSGDLVP